MIYPVKMDGDPGPLWITEIERVFGFPLHYTDVGNLSINKRQQLLGRSWSVYVVKWIFKSLKVYFKCAKKCGQYRRVIR
jgi:DNA (cytosine-5)-methyltransferase 3A